MKQLTFGNEHILYGRGQLLEMRLFKDKGMTVRITLTNEIERKVTSV